MAARACGASLVLVAVNSPTWADVLTVEAWRLWRTLNILPGSSVTIEELARLTKTSKTHARTALLELEERGFLQIGAPQ